MSDYKSKYLNFYFLGKLFLYLLFIGAFFKGFTNVYELISRKYIINESDIYQVDTFRLQGKAFYDNGGKYNSPSYDFSSRNGYNFTVDKKTYRGIIDKKQFADTFNYHDLKFIAYSDKKTLETYLKNKNPININAIQLQVGDKKFISIDKINKEHKNWLIRNVCIFTFLFLFILITYLRNRKIFE